MAVEITANQHAWHALQWGDTGWSVSRLKRGIHTAKQYEHWGGAAKGTVPLRLFASKEDAEAKAQELNA